MFRISKNVSVSVMSELFHQKVNHYDLRNPYQFFILNVNSVFHGQGRLSYLGPLTWQLVPSEFKDLNTVSAFKVAIRKWKPNNCSYRLCKTCWICWKCWKCWIYLNYLFGLTIDAGWSVGFFRLDSWCKGFP